MKTFDHNSGAHIDIDGAKIYYEITGDENATALLFLHGGFGDIEDANSFLARLQGSFRVIGIDSQGQGSSTLGQQILSYERLQKNVEQILALLDIDTLSVIGFSDGGIVGYRLASLSGLNIKKLVTIGSRWSYKNAEATKGILSRVTPESWRRRFPDTYEKYCKLNPEPDFDRLVSAIVRMWLDSDSSGYPNEAVKNITCPLLIVRGDNDHIVSREAVFELSELAPRSTLLNIPFAGHAAFLDQEEIFNLTLNRFLQE
ncbi:MAG TPA: alpha/beta hydrolase [Blastocatellia bacterium]|jgi:pimeloyl-ACP methyl ester carboxylesterase